MIPIAIPSHHQVFEVMVVEHHLGTSEPLSAPDRLDDGEMTDEEYIWWNCRREGCETPDPETDAYSAALVSTTAGHLALEVAAQHAGCECASQWMDQMQAITDHPVSIAVVPRPLHTLGQEEWERVVVIDD